VPGLDFKVTVHDYHILHLLSLWRGWSRKRSWVVREHSWRPSTAPRHEANTPINVNLPDTPSNTSSTQNQRQPCLTAGKGILFRFTFVSTSRSSVYFSSPIFLPVSFAERKLHRSYRVKLYKLATLRSCCFEFTANLLTQSNRTHSCNCTPKYPLVVSYLMTTTVPGLHNPPCLLPLVCKTSLMWVNIHHRAQSLWPPFSKPRNSRECSTTSSKDAQQSGRAVQVVLSLPGRHMKEVLNYIQPLAWPSLTKVRGECIELNFEALR
jgi:hypothetical protein